MLCLYYREVNWNSTRREEFAQVHSYWVANSNSQTDVFVLVHHKEELGHDLKCGKNKPRAMKLTLCFTLCHSVTWWPPRSPETTSCSVGFPPSLEEEEQLNKNESHHRRDVPPQKRCRWRTHMLPQGFSSESLARVLLTGKIRSWKCSRNKEVMWIMWCTRFLSHGQGSCSSTIDPDSLSD